MRLEEEEEDGQLCTDENVVVVGEEVVMTCAAKNDWGCWDESREAVGTSQ